MIAKDLMIGDWVQFPYGIRKVTELDSFLDRVCSADFSVGEVDGVPLTPEILEKNGFDLSQSKGEWSPSIVGFSFDNCWVGDELKWHRIHIKYVHQLQHALRLCGIDKTIEL